jgi:hypothetical protein
MASDFEKYAAYIATPFWDMRLTQWLQYVSALRGKEREVLAHCPFRWVYAPPHDGKTGIEFLRDHELGEVPTASIEDLQAKLPTFEALRAQGFVEWIEDRIDETPCYGFRQIPEWAPMAGLLIHWPTLYPPLWTIYREVIAALDHSTTFLRIPEGYFGATVLAWLGADELIFVDEQTGGAEPYNQRAVEAYQRRCRTTRSSRSTSPCSPSMAAASTAAARRSPASSSSELSRSN